MDIGAPDAVMASRFASAPGESFDASVAKEIYAAVGKGDFVPAVLALEDGLFFYGRAFGSHGEVFGEICFNTSMEDYLEVLSDPSYAGRIVAMTYPQIGNYGVNLDDAQSFCPALRGLVVHDLCTTLSNWRCSQSLPEYLESKGVLAIEGIDTRALVRHIREAGAQKAMISTVDFNREFLMAKLAESPSIVGVNLVESVSCDEPFAFDRLPKSHAFAVNPLFFSLAIQSGCLRLRRQAFHSPGSAPCRVFCHRGSLGYSGQRRAGVTSRRRFPIQRTG